MIAHNPDRHPKELRSHAGDGPPLVGVQHEDEAAEAGWVVRQVQDLVRAGREAYRDVAVLFRTAPQARAFEQELRVRAVPYVLVGGMSFFDRKEVRDALAFLRLAVQPDDELSLLRVVNTPPRGVGKRAVERAVAFATEQGVSAGEAFRRADEVDGLDPQAAAAVRDFLGLLRTAANLHSKLVDQVRAVIDAVGYRREVERLYDDPKTVDERWSAVEEVFNFAENHARKQRGADLASFLADVALAGEDAREDDDAGDRDAVTLMTLHAAKGLEFPRVYLVGLEEGLLPHLRSVEADTVEEERRLMYVGLTRARRHLTLSWVSARARFGQRVECHASRFLFETKGEPPPKGWLPAGSVRPPQRKSAAGKPKRRKLKTLMKKRP